MAAAELTTLLAFIPIEYHHCEVGKPPDLPQIDPTDLLDAKLTKYLKWCQILHQPLNDAVTGLQALETCLDSNTEILKICLENPKPADENSYAPFFDSAKKANTLYEQTSKFFIQVQQSLLTVKQLLDSLNTDERSTPPDEPALQTRKDLKNGDLSTSLMNYYHLLKKLVTPAVVDAEDYDEMTTIERHCHLTSAYLTLSSFNTMLQTLTNPTSNE